MLDLSPDALADVLGDADFFLASHGFDTGEVPSASRLCVAATGHPPELVSMRHEAYATVVNGHDRVFVARRVSLIRARWLVFHELAEIHHRRVGYTGEDVEARCNAMASALAAPRGAVRRAVRAHGHAVYSLAAALKTPQAATVLRIAEVVGRPCALLRASGPVVRGDAFAWPSDAAGFRRLLRERRPDVHPLRIADEPVQRWAFMAEAA